MNEPPPPPPPPPTVYIPYFNSIVSLTWGYVKVNLDFKVVNSKQVLRYTMLHTVWLVRWALLWIQFSAGRLCCHASNQNAHGMRHGAEIIPLHSCNLGGCTASSQECHHNWMNFTKLEAGEALCPERLPMASHCLYPVLGSNPGQLHVRAECLPLLHQHSVPEGIYQLCRFTDWYQISSPAVNVCYRCVCMLKTPQQQ